MTKRGDAPHRLRSQVNGIARPFDVLIEGRSLMKKLWCAAHAASFYASFLPALLGAALLAGPAQADPDPAGPANPAPAAPAAKGGGELEEIVVTAEKRESTVQATPIAITALTTADLAEENITTVEDMVGKVPGISLRTSGPGQT